jgi:glycosyltransferase involved in cell wall biosynthesis
MKTERIIFISHSGDKTGAPIVLTRLFRQAIKVAKADAFLVFRYHGDLAGEYRQEFGDRVFIIRGISPQKILLPFKPFSKIIDFLLLFFLFKRLKASVVVANSLINTTAIAAGLWNRSTVIVWAHEVAGAINDSFHLRRYWIKKVQAGIGVSQQSCDFLRELGLPPSRIHLIHNGLDLDAVLKAAPLQRQAPPRENLKLGVLATWSPNKRLDLAVETAVAVAESRKFSRVRLDVGGLPDPWNPDLFEEIMTKIKIKPENLEVRFLGQIDHLEAYYHELDGLLLTSDKESLPTVAIEAMAYQVPVFYFEDLFGAAEVLGDLIVPSGQRTGRALAEKILEFFASQENGADLEAWQKKALDRAQLFTLDRQWENFQKVVTSLE